MGPRLLFSVAAFLLAEKRRSGDYPVCLTTPFLHPAVTDHARGVSSVSAHNGHPTPCALGASAWYVLRVRPNAERTVERALFRASIPWFVPTYRERVRWSDRWQIAGRLLFPGYVFVRASMLDLAQAAEVGGVLGVLPSNLSPVAVSETDIENVRRVVSSMRPLEACDYQPGDLVTIQGGALRGVTGVVRRHARGARLLINVEMLGRAVSVELDADDLAKESNQRSANKRSAISDQQTSNQHSAFSDQLMADR